MVARTRFTRAGPRPGADQRDAGGGGIDAGRRRGHRAQRNAAHHRRRRKRSGARTPLLRAAGGVPFRRVREQLQRGDAANQRVQGDPGAAPSRSSPRIPRLWLPTRRRRAIEGDARAGVPATSGSRGRALRNPAPARGLHGIEARMCVPSSARSPDIRRSIRHGEVSSSDPRPPFLAASPHPRTVLLPRPGAGTGAGTPPRSRRRRRGGRRRFGDPAIRGAGTPAPDARQRGAHAGRSGGHHAASG